MGRSKSASTQDEDAGGGSSSSRRKSRSGTSSASRQRPSTPVPEQQRSPKAHVSPSSQCSPKAHVSPSSPLGEAAAAAVDHIMSGYQNQKQQQQQHQPRGSSSKSRSQSSRKGRSAQRSPRSKAVEDLQGLLRCQTDSFQDTFSEMTTWYSMNSPRSQEGQKKPSDAGEKVYAPPPSAAPVSSSRTPLGRMQCGSGQESRSREAQDHMPTSPVSQTSASRVTEMVTPLMACGSGMLDHIPRPTNVPSLSKMRSAVSRAVSGPRPPSPDQKQASPLFRFSSGFSGTSALTTDTAAREDEMFHLQRMTSWATLGTVGTMGTEATCDTAMTGATASTTKSLKVRLEDDDGHAIPVELLQQAERRRDKRRKGRRRVVKFEYPPISSLREQPRYNPEDLPNLFFTEEELDEIEDDRISTITADDVEIVAVATERTTASEESSQQNKVVSQDTTDTEFEDAMEDFLEEPPRDEERRQSPPLINNDSRATSSGNKYQGPPSPAKSESSSVSLERSSEHSHKSSSALPLTAPEALRGHARTGSHQQRTSHESSATDATRTHSESRSRSTRWDDALDARRGAGADSPSSALDRRTPTPGKTRSSSKKKETDARLLRGVQIYLRERSLG